MFSRPTHFSCCNNLRSGGPGEGGIRNKHPRDNLSVCYLQTRANLNKVKTFRMYTAIRGLQYCSLRLKSYISNTVFWLISIQCPRMTEWKQNLSILENYSTWTKDTLPLLSEEPLRFCTVGWVTITELWLNYFWIVLLEGPYQVFISITVYLSSPGHFFRSCGFDFILKFTDTHETLHRLVCLSFLFRSA